MERQITCINCPVGCRLQVTVEDGVVTAVNGHGCKRGDTYARQECVAPARMVTAAIPVENRKIPVSVKTRTPIPKEKIFACMEKLSQLTVKAPVKMGQVLLTDVCGTGVDVIATKNVE
ncbi:MAG: DUF1667 domain-containing protein [Clostridiales bacterium]|nr:DUF1667 domain-containing protein [Clostridiales bacterium]